MSGGNRGKAVFNSPEGGTGYWAINKTGAPSIKGYLLEAGKTVDNSVSYAAGGDPDPMAVVYDADIPDGEMMRIITGGRAYVYYATAVTRGTFSRVSTVAEALPAGQAVAEALPSPPFATDKHFQENGHPLETIAGPGLALTNLHFN